MIKRSRPRLVLPRYVNYNCTKISYVYTGALLYSTVYITIFSINYYCPSGNIV